MINNISKKFRNFWSDLVFREVAEVGAVVLSVLLLSIFAALKFTPSIKGFDRFADILMFIQTVIVTITLAVAILGVWEYVKNSLKKGIPEIRINNISTLDINYNSLTTVNVDFFNKGDLTINKEEVYLHIFIPQEFEAVVVDGSNVFDTNKLAKQDITYRNAPYVYWHGYLDIPVIPRTSITIFKLGFTCKKSNSFDKSVHFIDYYLSTKTGSFPKMVELDEEYLPVKNMLSLEVNLEGPLEA